MQAIKIVVLDVYNTLLDVLPGPERAGEMWAAFWQQQKGELPVAWDLLAGVMSAMVQASHRRSHLAGEEHPEVVWHRLLAEVCGVGDWSEADQRGLCLLEAKLRRKCALMPGAADFLLKCQKLGVGVALCSNGQSCTEQELLEAMLEARLDVDELFPAFRFWSYQHGFAKPSPKVFAWLETQFEPHGVKPAEMLMIGDNPQKDVIPASLRGWQTHLLVDANWPPLRNVS